MAVSKRPALLGLAALSVSAAVFADDARALLERMERSLAGRNYQGTFVHEHGGQTETLRIIHRAEAGGFTERVVSLDGSGREVIRRNGELRAYFPDQRAVLVDSGQRGGLLFPGLAGLDSAAGQIYAVREETHARCSGRNAHVVVVEPRDEFRYGYRVWIDSSSCHAAQDPAAHRRRPGGGTARVHRAHAAGAHPRLRRCSPRSWRATIAGCAAVRSMATMREPPADATWDASELPPGFRLISNSTQFVGGGQQPATHLVFSDGLASVSVFVEAPSAAARATGHRDHDDDEPRFLVRPVDRGRRAQGDGDRRSAARHRARHHPLAARRLRAGQRRGQQSPTLRHGPDAGQPRGLRAVRRASSRSSRQLRARASIPPVDVVDVDSDASLQRRWGLKVPVLLLDGALVCGPRLDAGELLRLLRL